MFIYIHVHNHRNISSSKDQFIKVKHIDYGLSDRCGRTPLIDALDAGSVACVELLSSLIDDITPMMISRCSNQNIDVEEKLVILMCRHYQASTGVNF